MGNQKTTLEFFGGINSIGGNKICLMSGNNSGILLDFGFDFSIASTYFDDFMKPRDKEILIDGIKLGMLPWPIGNLQGIYRKDLHLFNEKEIIENFKRDEIQNIQKIPLELDQIPLISDVLISHAHTDHISDIRYLDPRIKLITSEDTAFIMKHFNEIYSSSSKLCGILEYKPIDGKIKDDKIQRNLVGIKNNTEFKCAEGDITGILIDTDHSIPGACAFLLTDNITKKKIVYTGDIRKHGPLYNNTLKFLESAKNFKPDILIIEGTRVSRSNEKENLNREQDVMKSIKNKLLKIHQSDADKNIFFSCSKRDLWRILSFYKAGLSVNRILVISADIYYLLSQFQNQNKDLNVDLKNIKIFLPKKKSGTYIPKDYSNSKDILKTCSYPEEELERIKTKKNKKKLFNYEKIDLGLDKLIKAKEIQRNPDKYLVFLPFYSFTNLFDINPKSGSYYIISQSEPWDEEGEIEQKKFEAWLKLFGIEEDHIDRYHCSGHSSENEIFSMIEEINPKKVFPIHTEHPEIFMDELGGKFEVIIPKKGIKYEI